MTADFWAITIFFDFEYQIIAIPVAVLLSARSWNILYIIRDRKSPSQLDNYLKKPLINPVFPTDLIICALEFNFLISVFHNP